MSSTCNGCGKPIVWIRTPDGKRVPLDPSPPVYVIHAASVKMDGNGRVDQSQALIGERVTVVPGTRLQTACVTHFATCPNAGQFSGRNKPPTGQPVDRGGGSVPGPG